MPHAGDIVLVRRCFAPSSCAPNVSASQDSVGGFALPVARCGHLAFERPGSSLACTHLQLIAAQNLPVMITGHSVAVLGLIPVRVSRNPITEGGRTSVPVRRNAVAISRRVAIRVCT